MRNEKGITLVALILIIVALLILAGISISLVVSNEAKNIEIPPSEPQVPDVVTTDDLDTTEPESPEVTDDLDAQVEDNSVDSNTVADDNAVVNEVANTVNAEVSNEVEDVANVVE